MPYIITITTPDPCVAYSTPREPAITRCAVATLDEARKACIGIVQPYAAAAVGEFNQSRALVADICLSLMRKDWEGGTVGPLPDGTLIEVRATSLIVLEAALGAVDRESGQGRLSPDEVIDAYNAIVS